MSHQVIKVALVGNPNTGKTSIFNLLTGLNQKVGNYPGITVDKKVGSFSLSDSVKAKITDLPGTYSLNPNSLDEEVAVRELLRKDDNYPDVVVVITDIENLKQNLLIFTQVKDLNVPTILVLNMSDRMKSEGITVDIPLLEQELKTKIALVSTRNKTGIEDLKSHILNYKNISTESCIDFNSIDNNYFSSLSEAYKNENIYKLWLVVTQNTDYANSLKENELKGIASFSKNENDIKHYKQKETIFRYQFINNVLKKAYNKDLRQAKGLRASLDRIFIHKIWGYFVFLLLMMLIFQAVFSWSAIPMDWIGSNFDRLSQFLNDTMPPGPLTDLIANGIVPGIGGIVIFVPQIAFLFLFVSLLEESGYMSRVVFLADRTMRRFGLSGKSVVPLISGVACAIPAIMSARNIENWKERLITILVTPFITCSARLPIYLIVVELVIPDGKFLFFSYKALVFFALYVLGFLTAIFSAWILNKILKLKSIKTYFVMEMPNYKIPLFRNVAMNVYEKTLSFLLGAGKIILVISIILWFLSSHGYGEKYNNADTVANQMAEQYQWSDKERDHYLESYTLEHSFLGNLGKTIEPIFRPLGYDWKISIGVLSSFAAREVLVSTLASIYSLGGDLDLDDDSAKKSLLDRMRSEKRPDGSYVFTLATGVSLLLFYAFAMQCLSTLAVVKKETNSWKWPVIQLAMMSSFAYLVAFVAYQLLK